MTVTDDPDGARQAVADQVGFASAFPGYRAVLDRQGMSGVHETVVAGDEAAVEAAVRRYADVGATELVVSLHGSERERARTLDVLAAAHVGRKLQARVGRPSGARPSPFA